MRKLLCLFTLLFSAIWLPAQEFEGSWVMAYMRARQPVFTMIQQDGELSLEDETPEDSTIIQSSGLMVMTAQGKDSAVSYSWDGEEHWFIERLPDMIRFNGSLDSLYGNFDADGRLVLASTLDEVPTEYIFEPLQLRKKQQDLEIINTQWSVLGEADFLTNHKLIFQADSVLTNELDGRAAFGEYYIHPLGKHVALEFVINLPETYMGIIYFTRVTKRRLIGFFYAVIDDENLPRKVPVTLKR